MVAYLNCEVIKLQYFIYNLSVLERDHGNAVVLWCTLGTKKVTLAHFCLGCMSLPFLKSSTMTSSGMCDALQISYNVFSPQETIRAWKNVSELHL